MLIGNPLWHDFPELVTPDSHNCAEESVVAALRVLEDTGKKQYQDFLKNVLEDRICPINDPIKRNNLDLFSKPQPKASST